jgi:catechol 2,3-dioxygenase-like lactoylglutathione lyase family enzyme
MTITTTPRIILGLHHVQISVPETMEEAALEFYTQVLGLIPIDKPRGMRDVGGTWLQVGGLEVHLTTEEGVNRRSTKTHIAYRVDDLKFWRERMIAHEVSPIECTPIPGYDRFEARDPFGNRIEFIQRLA